MAKQDFQHLQQPDPNDWCPPRPPEQTPQDRRQLVSSLQPAGSLCHLGMRPQLITGIIRRLLIGHFSDPGFIEDPSLRDAVWQTGTSTGILIESVHRWIGSLTEKRPALLLKRNACRNMRIGLDDRAGTDPQGNEDYLTLWVGSHTVFCIHGTGASSEILATEAQRELTQFAPVVKRRLNLIKFSVTDVGEAAEVEESSQNYLVPVTIGWAYQESWKLIPEAMPLRQVDIDIRPSEL